eukprot:evm.model.scf_39.3 EVM.evm.TU.scf_39.3   scf_39:7995-12445(-)
MAAVGMDEADLRDVEVFNVLDDAISGGGSIASGVARAVASLRRLGGGNGVRDLAASNFVHLWTLAACNPGGVERKSRWGRLVELGRGLEAADAISGDDVMRLADEDLRGAWTRGAERMAAAWDPGLALLAGELGIGEDAAEEMAGMMRDQLDAAVEGRSAPEGLLCNDKRVLGLLLGFVMRRGRLSGEHLGAAADLVVSGQAELVCAARGGGQEDESAWMEFCAEVAARGKAGIVLAHLARGGGDRATLHRAMMEALERHLAAGGERAPTRMAYSLIESLGHRIAHREEVFDRVATALQAAGDSIAAKGEDARALLTGATGKALLPALMLLPGDGRRSAQAAAIIAALGPHSAGTAFDALRHVTRHDPALEAAHQDAREQAAALLRMEEGGREGLRRLAQSAPLSIALEVIDQAEESPEACAAAAAHCPAAMHSALVHCLRLVIVRGERHPRTSTHNLAVLAGGLCASIDPAPLMHGVLEGLRGGQTIALDFLTQILRKAGGVAPWEDVGWEALRAMAGSPALASLGGISDWSLPDEDGAENLARALVDNQDGKGGLGMTMLSLLLRAGRLDTADAAWRRGALQLMEFLRRAWPTHLAHEAPSIAAIMNTWGLRFEEAAQISRPVLRTTEAAWGMGVDPVPIPEGIEDDPQRRRLFLVFWSMSLQDIVCPVDTYVEQGLKLKVGDTASKEMEACLIRGAERSDAARARRLALQHWTRRVAQDSVDQAGHVQRTKRRLAGLLGGGARGDVARQFVRECLLPRLRLGSLEAAYCAAFVQCMHELGVMDGRACAAAIMCDVVPRIPIMGATEAESVGVFLRDILDAWSGQEGHNLHVGILKVVAHALRQEEGPARRNGLVVAVKIAPAFPLRWALKDAAQVVGAEVAQLRKLSGLYVSTLEELEAMPPELQPANQHIELNRDMDTIAQEGLQWAGVDTPGPAPAASPAILDVAADARGTGFETPTWGRKKRAREAWNGQTGCKRPRMLPTDFEFPALSPQPRGRLSRGEGGNGGGERTEETLFARGAQTPPAPGAPVKRRRRRAAGGRGDQQRWAGGSQPGEVRLSESETPSSREPAGCASLQLSTLTPPGTGLMETPVTRARRHTGDQGRRAWGSQPGEVRLSESEAPFSREPAGFSSLQLSGALICTGAGVTDRVASPYTAGAHHERQAGSSRSGEGALCETPSIREPVGSPATPPPVKATALTTGQPAGASTAASTPQMAGLQAPQLGWVYWAYGENEGHRLDIRRQMR